MLRSYCLSSRPGAQASPGLHGALVSGWQRGQSVGSVSSPVYPGPKQAALGHGPSLLLMAQGKPCKKGRVGWGPVSSGYRSWKTLSRPAHAALNKGHPGVSNLWPVGHMRLRMAMNEAQHKIVNLLKIL